MYGVVRLSVVPEGGGWGERVWLRWRRPSYGQDAAGSGPAAERRRRLRECSRGAQQQQRQ